MNNKVSEIWTALEKQGTGFCKKLYSAKIQHNLYCIYNHPDKSFGIALSFPNSIKINITPFERLSVLKINLYEDTSFKDHIMLTVQINTKEDIDAFSYMCENVIHSIQHEPQIKAAVKCFVNALVRWKKLFEKKKGEGLSQSEQQGLFGELHFLQKLLTQSKIDTYKIIEYYVGTDNFLRDFQGENWAVEVKTTSTNNPQNLTINGERQLDDTMIEKLYLYHLSVETSKMNGDTLVYKVSQIREVLNNELSSLYLFNAKLFEAGYFDEHEQLYQKKHYVIRSEHIYHVEGEFPRIRESELRGGVGNVTYGITIADCDKYIVEEKDLIDSI